MTTQVTAAATTAAIAYLTAAQIPTMFVTGPSGAGKTQFVRDVLQQCGMDSQIFDAATPRNKATIEEIGRSAAANQPNVLQMFYRNRRPVAIILDELEALQADKVAMTALVKCLRGLCPAATATNAKTAPIICIANGGDLRMRTVMHACGHVVHLTRQTPESAPAPPDAQKPSSILSGYLWHENVPDYVTTAAEYAQQLRNICAADVLDKVAFKTQIWQLHEMSTTIKVAKNRALCSATYPPTPPPMQHTKLLARQIVAHNNAAFIVRMCQQMGGMDKRELMIYFQGLLAITPPATRSQQIAEVCDRYDIRKLDVQRLQRYMRFYTDSKVVAAAIGSGTAAPANTAAETAEIAAATVAADDMMMDLDVALMDHDGRGYMDAIGGGSAAEMLLDWS